MNKAVLLFIMLFAPAGLYAQQPPAQLPSLVDENTLQQSGFNAKEKPEDILRKNIFVKAEASKKNVFVGEPFLVTYKLYTALNSQARVGKQPAFNGCSIVELSAGKEGYEENVNGKRFHVFIIRKVQVTALQEGLLQLGVATVENVVQLINAAGTGFDNFSATLANAPLSVEVKALPAIGKPLNFSGLEGDFSISAKADSNEVPVGENAVLHIVIKGSGNMAGIRTPSVEWPAGTEHFDGSDTQHIDQDNYPVSGYAAFDIPFIGTAEASVTIPAIKLSYFDAAHQAYKTISSNPVTVTFTKALTRNEQMDAVVTEDVSNRKYLWIVGAIAATVIAVWFISNYAANKKSQLAKDQAEKQETIIAKPEKIATPVSSSSEIFSALHDLGEITTEKDFLSKAKTFLTKALQNKFAVSVSNEQELLLYLKNQQGYAAPAITCEHIYTTCNRNLYSPVTDENIQEQLYFELRGVIKKLYELG